jgi:hypothetical protein
MYCPECRAEYRDGFTECSEVVEIPLEPLDAEETAELARLESAKPQENGLPATLARPASS